MNICDLLLQMMNYNYLKNIDVGSSTLICNTLNSGLNDVVFNLNSSEYLRLQLSDGTVRVPNTKSFLSQHIFY